MQLSRCRRCSDQVVQCSCLACASSLVVCDSRNKALDLVSNFIRVFSVSEYPRQAAAQLNSSLLTISVIAVLLPGAFHMALQGSQGQDEGTLDQEILKTSHGVRNGVATRDH